jgi:hypothetical protein
MIRTTLYALVLTIGLTFGVCAAAVTVPACAPTTYHTSVVVDDAVAQALFAVQKSEQAAFNTGSYSAEIHRNNATVILKALKAGQALNEALDRYTPGSQPSAILISTVRSFNDISLVLKDILPADNVLFRDIAYVVNLLSTVKG